MNLPKSAFGFILYFIKRQKFAFTAIIFISIFWALNDALFPYFLKRIVNILQAHEHMREAAYAAVKPTFLLLMGFWLTESTLGRIQGIISLKTFPRFCANMREAVFSYVKLHSHEFFASHFSGDLAKKLADLPNSSQIIMEAICFSFVTASMGSIIVLYLMWQINAIFAAIFLSWLIIHLGLTFLSLRPINERWTAHADASAVLSGKIVDMFTNMINVRLFARTNYEFEYMQKFQADEIRKAQRAAFYTEIIRCFLAINGLALIFGMVCALIYEWVNQRITLGDFTQIGMQTFWLLGWIWYISFQLTLCAREIGTINNSLTLIRRHHDIVDPLDAPDLIVKHGEIRFEDICFNYQHNKVVFNKLNAIIPAGKKIGLVGFSGSGKSTFVNLILRFYESNSGRILIDGQDITKVNQHSLRSQISMIPQDPSLFHRSLMENIRYGRLDATDDDVIEAAKRAHCHEFIMQLEEGYDALVGERGVKLSGGQRQRIAIARAILKNAPILILDEATSALDTVTEKFIQESLHDLMQNKTTIVIAHRLSTLANMDSIWVFHEGKIVEQGSQQELMQLNGYFARLRNLQNNEELFN